jgi:hypothetical protein
MAANLPEVQTLFDSAYGTVIKVNGYCDAAVTTNTTIVVPKALAFANTNQTCLLALTSVQYAVHANGYVQLAWQGATANTPIYTFGPSLAGTLSCTIPNNASSPTGNVVLVQQGMVALDSYSFILTFDKVAGYANGTYAYDKAGGAA